MARAIDGTEELAQGVERVSQQGGDDGGGTVGRWSAVQMFSVAHRRGMVVIRNETLPFQLLVSDRCVHLVVFHPAGR
nr:hypothetical protein CFP56_12970 [Quercus suber]